MKVIRLILAAGVMCAVAGCHGARERNVAVGHKGDLAAYTTALMQLGERWDALKKLPAQERLTTGLKELSEMRDEASVKYLQELVAVLDRYGIAVPEEARRVRAEPGRKPTPEEVARGAFASSAFVDGPDQMGPFYPPATASATQKAAGLLPNALWRELIEVTARWCPDRGRRMYVLTDADRPSDVAEVPEREYLARQLKWQVRREALWRNLIESMANRPGDPTNISVLAGFGQMRGTVLGMVFYYYANGLVSPGRSEIKDVAGRLRRAAHAAVALDPSPEGREAVAGLLKELEERKEDIEHENEGALEVCAQRAAYMAFLSGLERRDGKAMAAISTAAMRKNLEREADVWQAVAGERVRHLWIAGRARSMDSEHEAFEVAWENMEGKVHAGEGRDIWLAREGGKWRVAGFGEIGSPRGR